MSDIIDLVSLIERQIDISCIFCENIDLESPIDKTINIKSSVYADVDAELLRFEEIRPEIRVVSSKYNVLKPPNQRF
jgi:hypothetical protein